MSKKKRPDIPRFETAIIETHCHLGSLMRDINDTELVDFAAMTLEKNCSVRFIEYMPVIKAQGWQSPVTSGWRQ